MTEKLSKFTRLAIYGYLDTTELILKISKLSKKERA